MTTFSGPPAGTTTSGDTDNATASNARFNGPIGMASDGTYFYVAVDAEPVDKIMVMPISTSTASVVATYDSHGTNTQGLAFLNNTLYIVANEFKTIEKQYQTKSIKITIVVIGKKLLNQKRFK